MSVSGLGQFALGQPVPNRDHAVCVSLPTVRDLVGYEEKSPETLSHLGSGYPRFVQHRFIRQLIEIQENTTEKKEKESFLFANLQHCRYAIEKFSMRAAKVYERDGFTWMQVDKGSRDSLNANAFLQHTGGSISSRQAEDILSKNGLLKQKEKISVKADPIDFAQKIIAEVHGEGVSPEKVLFASSGANAFYALFRSAYYRGLKKGKTLWVRLGWLYLDTIETMELIAEEEADIITLVNPTDLTGLKTIFEEQGTRIAGIVTEFPTNPLLQSCELEEVKVLCDQVDALLIVDPTMASPKNAKVAHLADVLVNSLTKYACSEGDNMIGSLVFPEHSNRGFELFEPTKNILSPPFERDLLRLCEQLPFYSKFVEKTNKSILHIVDFLESSNSIKKVFWAYQKENNFSFQKMAGEEKSGCVVSFEVKGDFESFYNQLRMLKSPSFGTEFSLCCPYVYLAHYQMTKSVKGIEQLKKAGISPYLCRLSVGLEDPSEIVSTLEDALRQMKR